MKAGQGEKIARGMHAARGGAALAGQTWRRPRHARCEYGPSGAVRAHGRPYGCVSTRAAVVEAMLDMCGYTPDKDLSGVRLLDPAAGSGGAFVVAAMRRLAKSSSVFGFDLRDALARCITAVEVDAQRSRSLTARIRACVGSGRVGFRAGNGPVVCSDFLESDLGRFDIVVGNPPYVRHEFIPRERRAVYRELFHTFRGRSDLYVAFFEKALDSLSDAGRLCIVCPDRWMRNAYGAALRARLSSRHRVRAVIRIDGLDAFEERVQCYPAIVVVDGKRGRHAGSRAVRRPGGGGRIACHTARTDGELAAAAAGVRRGRLPRSGRSAWTADVPTGEGAWLIDPKAETAVEGHLAAAGIEEQGFRIGVGVATGADAVFTGFGLENMVEPDLLVPMIASSDIDTVGQITWAGRHLVNPYRADGSLADLSGYPMAQRYLESHRAVLESRYVARNGRAWYGTIDKAPPEVTASPKLLLPDLRANRNIAMDDGRYCPHNSLYYITGRTVTDLKALGAVMMSGFFVRQMPRISVCMRGGLPRWQAQGLRRARIPDIRLVDAGSKRRLAGMFDRKDAAGIDGILESALPRGLAGRHQETEPRFRSSQVRS